MLTELFGIELIICIKIDLALNNLQRLICHKTQKTKPPTSVLDLTLTAGDLVIVEYPFIPITPKSTLTQSGNTC